MTSTAGGAVEPTESSTGAAEASLQREELLTEASWQSLYQQHPIVVGGGIFPVEKLVVLPFWDRPAHDHWMNSPSSGQHTATIRL
jgi:hypothetical protein